MQLNKLIPVIFTLSAISAGAEVIRLSEPVTSDATTETFGSTLDQSLSTVSLGELVSNPDANLGRNLLIETRIGKVCQKKGCFFMATEGELAVRVSFRDYGFFVPTDSGGKNVILEGELVERELSPKQAAHFREDMGDKDNPSVAAGKVYEIVADGVQVPLGAE